MRIAHKVERITDEELDSGLAEAVAFRQASAEPPSHEAEHVEGAAPEAGSESLAP
jgi:hypothetical protein